MYLPLTFLCCLIAPAAIIAKNDEYLSNRHRRTVRRLANKLHSNSKSNNDGSNIYSFTGVEPGTYQGGSPDVIEEQQNGLLDMVQQKYPSARVLARLHKILNIVYIEFPDSINDDDDDDDEDGISTLFDTVTTFGAEIHPHTTFELLQSTSTDDDFLKDTLSHVQISNPGVRQDYCTTGKGIKVAVLDTGIDYTSQIAPF